jgi:ubiquinone/menaquinone biosynthesis C-methylase UbiE
MNNGDNYYIKDQIQYTTSAKTRPGWKRRYDFALQHITKTDIVLDCACGIGEGTSMIAAQCAKVSGVDIDSHFIEYCRATYSGIDFLCHDIIRRLPFEDEHFSTIVSLETLEHLPSIDMVHSALKNFHRVLKSGGTLITSVPNSAHTEALNLPQRIKLMALRFFGNIIKKQTRWHEHYQFWNANTFENLLKKYFSVVSVYGEWAEGISQNTDSSPYLIARAKK